MPARLVERVGEFLQQSAALAGWLGTVPADVFGRPSVLDGWDVRALAAHLVLVQQGFARAFSRPSDDTPLRAADYVRRYHPAAAEVADRTRTFADDRTPAELIDLLGDTTALRAAAQDTADRSVVLAGRGPITALDWATTRVLELVLHCDDLSRSVTDHDPVPLQRAALATAVRTSAEILAAQAPGRSVEVRVPPFVAVQAVPGLRHTRGTPPNVVEAEPVAWLRVATGRLPLSEALADGSITASGTRADLSAYLPLLS